MTLVDAHGNAVSTSSRPALDASERALWRMMSFYGTPIDDLDAAIAADAGWAFPHAMKAGFLLLLTEPAMRADALHSLADARRLGPRATDRERDHLGALGLLADGDWVGAGAAWSGLLANHPRDALALQWGHLLDFHRGDAQSLRERVAAALPAWHEADPLQPFVLGLHAFGLEESGCYAEAEDTGRRALGGAARVPWAIHAVAHVMEMQGRHLEGLRWMAQWRPDWGGSEVAQRNGFAGHLGWHEALFALESLDHRAALATFDDYLRADATEIVLQRLDAASLLWRLHLLGVDVGERWQRLLDGWSLEGDAAGHSVFNDMHATLALLGAGEAARAAEWVALAVAQAERRPGWNREVSHAVGAPLMHGLLAFDAGRFDAAFEAMAPLRAGLARIGGSHAQRDVVDQTLLAAAALGAQRAAGRALLAERSRARAATPLSRHWQRTLAATAGASP